MAPIRLLSAPLVPMALATLLTAQVPTDGVVIFESAGAFAPASCKLVDAAGGGTTELFLGFGPLSFTPPTAVATDPSNPQFVWFLNEEGAPDAGIQRSQLGLLATTIGTPTGFAWTQAGGSRIRIGNNRVFTLRSGGVVEATPKAGGAPFLVLTKPDAIDIAVVGSLLYVACRDATNPATPAALIEFSLLTGNARTVGNYPDLRRIAVRRTPGRVAVGTGAGTIAEIDTTNGAIVAGIVATGPIESIAYTRSDTLVYGVGRPGGFDVFSSVRAAPLYSSSTLLLIDLDVAVARTATATPFGSGCAAAAAVEWATASAPRLGNAAFALTLDAAPPSAPVFLFFGGSRVFAPSLAAPLPLSLGSLAVGCQLLVDPLWTFPVLADATGSATQALPVPTTPSLAGVEVSGQAFVPDPSVGPLSLAGSRGIALRLEP